MRTADQKNQAGVPDTEFEGHPMEWGGRPHPVTHRTYHELADQPVIETDALTQLDCNIRLLEDLQGRLSFLMREVRYLMKA